MPSGSTIRIWPWGSLLAIARHKARITVKELMALYHQTKETAGRRSSTLGGYSVSMRHIAKVIGHIPTHQLRAEHVDRLLRYLTRDAGFSAKYVSGILVLQPGHVLGSLWGAQMHAHVWFRPPAARTLGSVRRVGPDARRRR